MVRIFIFIYILFLVISLWNILCFKPKIEGTISKLSILMIYSGITKPLGLFPLISTLLDCITIILIVYLSIKKGIRKKDVIIFFLSVFFIMFSMLQMFNGNIPSYSIALEGFRKTAIPFFMLLLGIVAHLNEKQFDSVIYSISKWSIPILIYGIKQHFFYSSIDDQFLFSNAAGKYTALLFGQIRATSIFSGPFHLGAFSVLIALIFLYSFYRNRKSINLIGMLISILSCYSSLTRTNLVALIISVILFLYLKKRRKVFVIPFIFSFSLFIGANIFFGRKNIYNHLINSSNYFSKMLATLLFFNDDSRFEGRIEGWLEIPKLIAKQPFVAYGTGSAGDTLGLTYNIKYWVNSHNFFLKVLMETGVIGLIIILLIFCIFLFRLVKTINIIQLSEERLIYALTLSLMIVFLINSLVGSTIEMYPYSNITVFIIGVVTCKNSEEKVLNEKENRIFN